MSARAARQRALRSILAEHDLRTQAEVREALSASGHHAHTATVGRDLEESGARRVRTPDGQLAYRTGVAPVVPAAAPDVLDEALRRYLLSVEAARNLLVLRTPPACASPVASALDAFGGPAILGTLAGDDTVIAVVADGHDPDAIASALRRRAAGDGLTTSGAVAASRPDPRTTPDRSQT
jgi:transcriptional regulator of arginine metabolism